MKIFSKEDLKIIDDLNARGDVGNERIGAMMAYLFKHGIRYWDGAGGISFLIHGYIVHAKVLSNAVRQFEHVLRITGNAT